MVCFGQSVDPETDLLKKHTNGRLETTSDTDILMNAGTSQDYRPLQAVVCPILNYFTFHSTGPEMYSKQF